jgi:hypothetical protein
MADAELSDQIARLEARIEQRDRDPRRQHEFPAPLGGFGAVGAVLLLATLLGLIRFDQTTVVGSIAAVLGGIVGLGSNTTDAGGALSGAARAPISSLPPLLRLSCGGEGWGGVGS